MFIFPYDLDILYGNNMIPAWDPCFKEVHVYYLIDDF